MKDLHIRLSDELHAELEKSAGKNCRSLNKEIEYRLNSTIKIPVIGKIKDGVITIEEELARR